MLGAHRPGGLTMFDFLHQYRETMGRLFGAELMFTWRPQSKRLFIQRMIKAEDEVVLHVYMYSLKKTYLKIHMLVLG